MSFKKILLILTFLLLEFMLLPLFAQDGDTSNIRMNWFQRDRAYPLDTIPSNSMLEALDKAEQLVQNHGYFLNGQSSGWISIGPTPECGVENNYCVDPLTGRIQAVKFNRAGDILYIAGHNGGIWRTTNLGPNWSTITFTPITDELPTQSAGAIGIDPLHSNIIYYASGATCEAFAYNFYGIGVFKTTNSGANWYGPYYAGLPHLIHSYKIAVNPYNGDVYLALGMDKDYSGLYKSTNGGVNWNYAPNVTQG